MPRFSRIIGPETLSTVDSINDDKCKVAIEHILEGVDELKENPFADRLCQVFSQETNTLGFEDFLDMMSIMSDSSPSQVVFNCFRRYINFISLGQS